MSRCRRVSSAASILTGAIALLGAGSVQAAEQGNLLMVMRDSPPKGSADQAIVDHLRTAGYRVTTSEGVGERGATMNHEFLTPARRVFIGMDNNTFSQMTDNGRRLFDAAVASSLQDAGARTTADCATPSAHSAPD